LVYQDHPGEGGSQPSIFKRFYWWEEECSQRIRDRFGVRIVKRSFEELGARAKAIPDSEAAKEWVRLRDEVPLAGVSDRATLSAVKLYRAVRDDLDNEHAVLAVGINCLNESGSSDTTPCLAWDLLYTEREMIWGCEADTVSMLTKFIVHRSLGVPVMMTNLYPFLMGQAALRHERIPAFPQVDDPANHVLAAHCGYLGVLPRRFAVEWKLRPRALAIVDENATAIDARFPVGDLTLAKLGPTFDTLSVVEGELAAYAGFPGSDCLNGAVIRVPDGHALMERLPSHHSVLLSGHDLPGLKLVGQIFGLQVEKIGG
jgi:L-fucose isomerase-like protein